jgi:flagellar motor switch protein FliM
LLFLQTESADYFVDIADRRLSTLADFMKQAKEMAERIRTGAAIPEKYRKRDKEIPPNQFQFLDELDIDD